MKLSSPGADGAEIVTSPAIAAARRAGPARGDRRHERGHARATPRPPGEHLRHLQRLHQLEHRARTPCTRCTATGAWSAAGRSRSGCCPGTCCRWSSPGTTPPSSTWTATATTRSPSRRRPRSPARDRSSSTAMDRRSRPSRATAANCPDQGEVVNLADYPSVGDLSGDGTPDVVKGGLTLNGVANLLAVNQNLPFCHVEQAWDPATGSRPPRVPARHRRLPAPLAGLDRSRSGERSRSARRSSAPACTSFTPTAPPGVEAPGWPKFTGGWIQSTPAVGDADGDGKLDVAALTREGWSFLWKTGVSACGGSNNQWWTFHHDEHGTAKYGVDGRPPGSPEDLVATRNAAGGRVAVSWKQPGDDWLCGSHAPARYRVLVSSGRIDDPERRGRDHRRRRGPRRARAVSRTLHPARGRNGPAPCGALSRQRRELGPLAERRASPGAGAPHESSGGGASSGSAAPR